MIQRLGIIDNYLKLSTIFIFKYQLSPFQLGDNKKQIFEENAKSKLWKANIFNYSTHIRVDKQQMKQTYEVLPLLEKYFKQIHSDLNFIKLKKIPAKKSIYKAGDLITNIYLIISGEFQLSFQQKDFIMPNQVIVGDYQPENHLSRRMSTLKAITASQIAILPFDFFFNFKDDVIDRSKFLLKHLNIQDRRIKYLITKFFTHKQFFRGEQLILEQKQNKSDLAIIQKGIFSIKKYIGVGVIQKYNIQVEKQFALIQIGEGEIVKQNLTCQSPKGQLYICQHIHIQKLLMHFEELQLLFDNNKKKESHLQRQQSIKNICFPKSDLFKSILPSIFQNSQRKSTLKHLKKKKIINELPSDKSQELEINHFTINRTDNNQLQSKPSSSNFSLIPFKTIRKPSLPLTTRVTQKKILQKFIQQKNQNPQINSPKSASEKYIKNQKIIKTQEKEYKIPQIFDNKFKRKMFLKANNPFHHYKSKSLSLDEHIIDVDKFFKDPLIRKSSTISQHKRSKHLQIEVEKQIAK